MESKCKNYQIKISCIWSTTLRAALSVTVEGRKHRKIQISCEAGINTRTFERKFRIPR